MGGGSISPGGGGPSNAKAGDASSNIAFDFTSNNAFTVGGSGKQSVDAATSGGGATGNNTLLYIGIGVAAVALLAAVYATSK